jgi:alpha-tubulin suppressor-like RCC1 family protein
MQPVCGNDIVEGAEQCDGYNLNQATCESYGFIGGALTCTDCHVDTTGCFRCSDGVCDQGETASSCPEDCGVMRISAGKQLTCAVLADRSARCWGDGWLGQVGSGTTGTYILRPERVSSLDDASDIEGGDDASCAIDSMGIAYCWGASVLGDGFVDGSAVPVPIAAEDGVEILAVGTTHTCVLNSGQVMCWGYNHDAFTLGFDAGPGETVLVPTPLPGLSDVVQIDALGFSSCALLATGNVTCWGDNLFGQLGSGDNLEKDHLVEVGGLENANAVALGAFMGCALLDTGEVQCWGTNYRGHLGDGTLEDRFVPGPVLGVTGAVAITAGGGQACALMPDQTLMCWGSNDHGELGPGQPEIQPVPSVVSGVSGVIAVSAGAWHTCALLVDGTMRCWGENAAGQLGNGTQQPSAWPVEPDGL